MPNVKTTVYLEAAEYRRLKGIAARQGRSTAELIRIAVSEYAAKHEGRPLPASLGAGRSGDGSLSERAEELLKEWREETDDRG